MPYNVLIGLGLMLASVGNGYAGELKCTFNCTLGGFMPSAKWEATGCTKPYPLSIMAYDAASYNQAVDEFNNYLSSVDRYLNCVVQEANADIQNNVPKIIKQGVKDAESEMRRKISSLKSQLEMAKITIQ